MTQSETFPQQPPSAEDAARDIFRPFQEGHVVENLVRLGEQEDMTRRAVTQVHESVVVVPLATTTGGPGGGDAEKDRRSEVP